MVDFEYRVETSLEEGVFNHGKFQLELEDAEYDIPLPVKTVPAKKITAEDGIFPEFKLVNEVYHSIDAVDLRNAIHEDNPRFVDEIKRKQRYSDEGELDIVLLNYSETKPMTGMEAQEFVSAIDEVSDVITSPLQFPLLHSLVDGDGADSIDNPFHHFRHTKENFLDEAADLDSKKPTMSTLSFLPDGQLNQLLALYDDFDVEMLGVDFYGKNPTTYSDDELGDLIGRLSALDMFDGTVMFAYNMSRSEFRANTQIRTAENFAPVGMGFDILGGNHIGLPFPPSDDQQNFSVFDPDVAGYRPTPVDTVVEDWPVTVQSNICPERVDSFQINKANKLVSLIIAEQIQRALSELRTRLEQGHESNYLGRKEGIGNNMITAFEAVQTAYAGGADPGLNDY